MKQIMCMKWGTLYNADYVNKLYGSICNQLDGDFRFVCLTDDQTGIRAEVECMDCPTIDIPEPYCNTGWRKLTVWADTLPGMNGTWLYLDLDVVITGSLDDFFSYQPEKSFIVMQNWTQPGKGIGNTSVFRFNVGSHPYLYERAVNEFSENFLKEFLIEQTYISRTINEMSFWPDEWCILFKTHCVPSWPARFWKTPVLPSTAKIVAFPGDPNPDAAMLGHWPVKKAYKRIYKHIRPTPWIRDVWNAADQTNRNMEAPARSDTQA